MKNTINFKHFAIDYMTDPTKYQQMHFRAPTINLTVRYHRGNELFGTEDTTTFTNAETGEEIITVPSNIKEISTWDDWKKCLKKISKHSPVYRVIKAIFDGNLFADKEPEDAYEEDYRSYILGYEI